MEIHGIGFLQTFLTSRSKPTAIRKHRDFSKVMLHRRKSVTLVTITAKRKKCIKIDREREIPILGKIPDAFFLNYEDFNNEKIPRDSGLNSAENPIWHEIKKIN